MRWMLVCMVALNVCLVGASSAFAAAPGFDLGELRVQTTIHSIGIEWDVTGDDAKALTCQVQYRRQGEAAWSEALPLVRMRYAWAYGRQHAPQMANMLAGSILFLSPAVAYEVQLRAIDDAGHQIERQFTTTTRPWPQMPAHGRQLHVTPGNGGGTGAAEDPLQGIAAADKAARPGDVLLLHAGNYGVVTLNTSGAADGQYIVWKPAGDGEVVFDRIKLAGDFVWLHGVTVRRDPALTGGGVYAMQPVRGAVLTHNQILGFGYCITLNPNCRDWHIADNVLVGDKDFSPAQNVTFEQHLEGEGIELAESGGHVVCYNRISHVADGVSYPGANTDIFGNDIFDVTDDALEPDRGGANVRLWGNRLTNFGEHGLSFQPMYCGPWYLLYNQVIGSWRPETKRIPYIFKFRVLDRFVCVGNTFVFGRTLSEYSDCLFLSRCRNNLFISATGFTPIWTGMRYPDSSPTTALPLQAPTEFTDLDYNGYDWGNGSGNAFRYQGSMAGAGEFIKDLAAFSQLLQVEQHGRQVTKEDLFQQWNIPAGAGRTEPYTLELRPGSAAIDAGAVLPNIADCFVGAAPDLGAMEYGEPRLSVGPRPLDALDALCVWSMH